MARDADLIVKPHFDHGGGGIVATKPGQYTVHGPDGEVLDTIEIRGQMGEHGIKGQSSTIQNGLPPGSYITAPDGTDHQVSGGDNKDYFYTGEAKPFNSQRNAGGGGGGAGGGGGGGGGGNTIFGPPSGGGFVGAGPGAVPLPLYIDPSALYEPFQPTDILGFAGQTSDFNRQQYQQSFETAQKYAQQLVNTELQSLKAFSGGAETLQENLATRGNQFNRQEIGVSNKFNQGEFSSANKFNQSELDRTLQGAAPFIRPSIEEAVQRNRTYAQGKLLSTAEDRAFELTARSMSADNSFVSGFGSDSALADKASTLLSAQQRLQLSQQGDQALSGWLSKANELLVSRPLQYTPLIQQPLQSTIAGDIKGQPRIAGSELASKTLSELSGLTTIQPGQAVQLESQQNQFGQQLNFEQRTAVYNALMNYANQTLGQLNTYSANTFASSQQLNAGNTASGNLTSGSAPPASNLSSSAPAAVPPPAAPPSLGTGTGAPGAAPTVASQAQVPNASRLPQLTSDNLYRYYQ